MRIDKALTEKERYQSLREAGYSPSEARKFRRYGGQKFFDKLAEKNIKEYNKQFEKVKTFEEKENIKIIPDIPRKTKARYKYKFKYNYIIRCIIDTANEEERKQGKEKLETHYFTYTTDYEIPKKDLIPEIQNYIDTINRKYDYKVVDWQITAIEVV